MKEEEVIVKHGVTCVGEAPGAGVTVGGRGRGGGGRQAEGGGTGGGVV